MKMRVTDAFYQWSSLTPDGQVLWLKYTFGPGTANCLAARGPDGGWIVVSPAVKAPESAFEKLAAEGEVSALIAPNAYHSLGQMQWRARFPGALSYAPEGALERLKKTAPDVPFHPIRTLEPRLAAWVRLFEPDGMKSPDLIIEIEAGGERIWWLGDLFSNNTKADQIWLLRQFARFAGGGLGFRCNSKPEMVYVRDRTSWKTSVQSELNSHAPSMVVPADGDPIMQDAASQTLAALGKLPDKSPLRKAGAVS
jgi:hypothetical protein